MKVITWSAVAILACCQMYSLANAGQLEDARDAIIHGDYGAARLILSPLADQGQPDAQYYLGQMYASGFGVPHDAAVALKWYRLAAEQGQAKAQFNLGLMYYSGIGLPQDYEIALKWYLLSAEHGDMLARSRLSSMYLAGRGTPVDRVQAYMWWILASPPMSAPLPDGPAKLTAAEIANAQLRSQQWLAEHPTP